MRRIVGLLGALMLAVPLLAATQVAVSPSPAQAAPSFTSHTGPHDGSSGPNPKGTVAVNAWSSDLPGASWNVDQVAFACSDCSGNVRGFDFKIVGSNGQELYHTTFAGPFVQGVPVSRYPNITVGNGACWKFSATAGTFPGDQVIHEGWRVISGGPASCHDDWVVAL